MTLPNLCPHPVQPVILCGGSGTRLWPLSRAGFPKQFLCLTGDESLFQLAAKRLAALGADDIAVAAPLIVSGEEHRFLASEQLREAGIELGAALLEPVGRNTAPALTLAALAAVDQAKGRRTAEGWSREAGCDQVAQTGADPILVVTPADQTVADQPAFTRAMQSAIREAASGAIVILGIAPDRPETGYGYIQTSASLRGEAEAIHTQPLDRHGLRPRDDTHTRHCEERSDEAIQQASGSPRFARDDDNTTRHCEERSDAAIQTVKRFVEKPDAATAQTYLDAGGYYWNAGMFVLKASVWLAALERFRPDIAQATRLAWEKRKVDENTDQSFVRPGKAEFTAIPAESIDYAVMEPLAATEALPVIARSEATRQSTQPLDRHGPPALAMTPEAVIARSAPLAVIARSEATRQSSLSTSGSPRASGPRDDERSLPSLKMIPLDAGWSDLGAWDAVWQVLPKDSNGNAHLGDVLTTDSRNTLVHATSRLVSLVGVQDLVVIETPDAVLVADKSRSQDVKTIVAELHATGRDEHTLHRKVHRPWGWYDSIDDGHRFKVKRIQVKPKASLSLQKHHHRAEHWIVVKGTAEITNGDKVILLTENQSTYIPLGETHRLANPGTIPLEIIEVQSGSYLGEDDIVRFEDNYGRSKP